MKSILEDLFNFFFFKELKDPDCDKLDYFLTYAFCIIILILGILPTIKLFYN